MAKNLFHVSSNDLKNLINKWENAAKPDHFTFDGFAIKLASAENVLTFHPLYRHVPISIGDDKMFVKQLTAGECPNPPGYDEIASWREIDPTWPE
jgi:hypothetical protein